MQNESSTVSPSLRKHDTERICSPQSQVTLQVHQFPTVQSYVKGAGTGGIGVGGAFTQTARVPTLYRLSPSLVTQSHI